MNILNINEEIELAKRFYLPGIIIKHKCPECDTENINNLGENYLSYPITNKKEEIYFCCIKCNHEYLKSITIKMSVELH